MEDPEPFSMFTVNIFDDKSERAKQVDFSVAKKQEVEGFKAQNIWHKVKQNDLPPDANIVGRKIHTNAQAF